MHRSQLSHTYTRVTSHVYMSHVTHRTELCHPQEKESTNGSVKENSRKDGSAFMRARRAGDDSLSLIYLDGSLSS